MVLYNLFWELDSGQDSASLESADEGDLYHVAWEICFLTEALPPPKKPLSAAYFLSHSSLGFQMHGRFPLTAGIGDHSTWIPQVSMTATLH